MAEADDVQADFERAQQRWRRAIQAHRMAPPDAGFSERLAELAGAAAEEAEICRRAAAEGYEWPPHKAGGKQPYELQPNTGRRGPEKLWAEFDAAVGELTRAAAETDLVAVARAHELIAGAAQRLADAVAEQDRASGLLPSRRRRRSA